METPSCSTLPERAEGLVALALRPGPPTTGSLQWVSDTQEGAPHDGAHPAGQTPRGAPREAHPEGHTPRGTGRQAGEDTFDLAAAGLRGDGAELAVSVEVLAAKLEQALPGQARVERRGAGLLGRGAKRVRQVRVELGGAGGICYQLAVDGTRVEGFRERQSGGIAIKREPLDPNEWIAALTADLRAEAERSAQARAALEELLR